MIPGRFITLEGIEGAGKSTQARLVAQWLRSAGFTVHSTREPGGTALAERLRRVVLERGEEDILPVTETLLMFAARAQHVAHLIRPALQRGEWVVCDRFTDATRAYQGGGRGVDAALIDSLAGAVQAGVQPDCTLLLDLPAAIGLARAHARSGGSADRFEAETLAFFERVRESYLAIARGDPRRVRLIDASAAVQTVQARIEVVLGELVHEARASR
ncbi:MAG: dTMP kinase [Proteobacteria bacterium]|nr:dTMP kinase [Pseudomonadota bacterium]